MIQLPAIHATLRKAKDAFLRFTLPVLFSVAAALLLLELADDTRKSSSEVWEYVKICLTLSLALPVFISLQVFSERHPQQKLKAVLHVLFLAFFVWYWYALGEEQDDRDIVLYFLLSIAGHLMVAFFPFLRDGDMSRCWDYNKSVFLRILVAALYSGVLFGGLSIALAAIDQLFEVRVSESSYLKNFILTGTVFNTWFFLSGFPSIRADAELPEYPKGLRVFTQFVLIPLVTIYLLILYAYIAKIIWMFTWPRGWVSYLVIGFSISGLLALLLVWPLREMEKFRWIKWYARSFFVALLPLIVLLLLSIFRRVSDYGITVNRYFILILAFWLLAVALYFLLSRAKQIRLIPLSLFVAAIVSAFGPWSAYPVAFGSQRERLLEIAGRGGFLGKDVLLPATAPRQLSLDDRKSFSAALDYLVKNYPFNEVAVLFPVDADSLRDTVQGYQRSAALMKSVGLEYSYEYGEYLQQRYSFSLESYRTPVTVRGYDYSYAFSCYQVGNCDESIVAAGDSVFMQLKFKGTDLIVKSPEGKEWGRLSVAVVLKGLVRNGKLIQYKLRQEELDVPLENEVIKARLLIRSCGGPMEDNNKPGDPDNIDAVFLFTMK